MGKYLLAALLVLGLGTAVYAAPVGLTSEADVTEGELWADNNIGVSAGFIFDSVSSRKIDVDSGEFEMAVTAGRIGLSVIDRFNLYIDIGQAGDMELDFTDKGELIQVKYEDETLWGVGLNALIYRWDNGLEVGAGASYRTADMNMEEVIIAGVIHERNGSQVSAVTDGELEEIQAAVELAWRTDYFIPYVGVKYSDIEVDAKFTVDAQERLAVGKNSSQNVGAFVGLTITPKIDVLEDKSERISINIEARFIDEEAISVGASYKF